MPGTDPRPEAGEIQPDELYGVSGGQVADLRAALDAHDLVRVEEMALALHTADLADLIEGLAPSERRILIDILGPRVDPELLTFLAEPVREEVVGYLGPADVAAAVTEMDTDDALDVVASLDQPVQAEVLEQLEAADRAALEEALAHPEDSAGRLMQREFVAVPARWTVGETIDYLREEAERGAEHLPEEFLDLFVVDDGGKPLGMVSLSRILRTRRPVRLQDLMDTDIDRIPVTTDQEEVAHLFRQYDLASAPVVDAEGRMVGVITHDDVMDVVHEEAEEDILGLAGIRQDSVYDSVLSTSRSRISWLFLSLLGLLCASLVIWLFEDAIEEVVALAVLMPIVAALGGNAGIQAMTVAVRALSMKELHRGNALRILGKEIMVAAVNGLLLAVVVGIVAGLWFSSVHLGAILAGSLVINLLAAGAVGVIIPFTLSRFSVDPAIASSPFLITVTDTVGFAAFLGSATYFLL
jgi:magnesium transporter